MRLAPADELQVLRRYRSVRALMRRRVIRGHCEVLPAIVRRASEWHAGAIGPRGGPFEPPGWEPDPIVPCPPVYLFRLRDVFYFPQYGVVVSAAGEAMRRSMEEAAYITPDLAALPHTARVGNDTFLDCSGQPVETLDRAAVSLPWGGVQNYGHFVLDCLTGAVVMRDRAELDAYPLVFPALAEWQRRHLRIAGLAPVELDGPVYLVRDLVFTSCMAHFLHAPNLVYRSLRARQLNGYAASPPGAASRIYLSRGKRSYRRFLSEEALQSALRDRGFAIVAPEERTVDEQIALFQGADVVVAQAGAAQANILYCSPGARVVDIKSPLTSRPWQGWLSAIVGLDWRPYYCQHVVLGEVRTAGGVPRPAANFAFDADLDDLLRIIDQTV